MVFVESYNEVTEGSHLMPSWPITHSPGDGHWKGPEDLLCMTQPCHTVEFTDTWGPANPWHYVDLTRKKIREWLEGAPAGDPDLIAPHALIVAPRDGQEVSGVTSLRIAAADDRSLREMRVYLDGFLLLRATTSLDIRLKTAFLANGPHVLAAEVTDQAGNTSRNVSEFFVRN